MSESNPEVIQGRLGWEPGDVSEADPQNLNPHPKNTEIYGDTEAAEELDETFVGSVAENGVLEPLVITRGKKIISGHRRWLAAKATDTDTVPVRYTEFDDELSEREALVEFNRQREKTPGQIVNEFEEMLAIEKQRGRESQGPNSTKNLVENDGDAQTRAAKKVNADVSGETLRKGQKVKKKAESEDEPEEVREAAQDAWNDLKNDNESFNGAYQTVKTAENKAEKRQRRQTRAEQFAEAVESDSAVEVDCGDFAEVLDDTGERYDHIITDPPYDDDAIEQWQKLATLARDVLKPGGLLVAYSGKYHLPQVYAALGSELEYFWQAMVVHSGSGARVWQRNIRTNYKPVLVYAKPPVEKLDGLGHDVIKGAGREKDDHEWQQATGEAVELVDQLTEPNDRILDPMCGSGTTGVAALEQNRQVHLIDRDDEAVATARRRCADVI
jgi:16S rRNA G966 N2-methylase RsmD